MWEVSTGTCQVSWSFLNSGLLECMMYQSDLTHLLMINRLLQLSNWAAILVLLLLCYSVMLAFG